MKYSLGLKFLAITLCALSIVAIVVSSAGIFFMEGNNLYHESLSAQKNDLLDSNALSIAWHTAERYAAENLGNCPVGILDDILPNKYIRGEYAVQIAENGKTVYSLNDSGTIPEPFTKTYNITPKYPIVVYRYTLAENGTNATEPPTSPSASAGEADATTYKNPSDNPLARVEGLEPLYTDEHIGEYWDEYGIGHVVGYTLNYYQGPEYQVTVWLSEKSVLTTDFALTNLLHPYRNLFIPILLISLAVFAVTLVYLCVAAGRSKSGEIAPVGLNRLPLDLYLLLTGGGEFGLAFLIFVVIESFYHGYYSIWDNLPLCMLVLGLGGFGIALLAIAFLFAFAAQVKVKNGYWWKHSILGWLLTKILAGIRLIYRGGRAIFRMLPVVWQWLLTAFAMILALSIPVFMIFWSYSGYWQFFWLVATLGSALGCICIVCYGAYCFGTLLKGIKYMAQGYIHHQIPTSYLSGPFREFAKNLNSLAGAVQVAAAQQMKSERMKTELITNVSHDIKTPLTSIINYVDLLKMPHNEAEGAQYLEVLDRQSHRLKKLVDDLIEMSKASSGNIQVELGPVDAAEAVNQALGEFADKLDAIALIPVVRHPEEQVTLMADGRLVWRVLSNLLSNAVKYSLPGTRLYVDIMALQGSGIISIKNVSKEALNIDPSELMERFVRGDAARNTDGSGLGLNIAKSLVELQRGQMHLMVDGDLFKVTLVFPLA